jgi:hypothetical protein
MLSTGLLEDSSINCPTLFRRGCKPSASSLLREWKAEKPYNTEGSAEIVNHSLLGQRLRGGGLEAWHTSLG